VANEASLPAMLSKMNATGSYYLIRAMDPNGEKHGVYAPRDPCPPDEPCPLAARHGYFESAVGARAGCHQHVWRSPRPSGLNQPALLTWG
jgi:hypothetical protein